MKTKLLTIALMMLVVVSCNQKDKDIEIPTECVDLGLSVKWATMNVGAITPEGYGMYFAWGETAEKTDYSWDTYKYNRHILNKYSTIDGKTTLEPEDDAAHVNWGGTWRMPTNAEWKELRERCTWELIKRNKVKGYLVTAPNGNSIFLPAAGYRDDTRLRDFGSYGYYWSSSLYEDDSDLAWSIDLYLGSIENERNVGQSVRPVCP